MPKTQRRPRGGALADARTKPRRRPTPKWLLKSAQLDAVARSRCLLVLSVLSGEMAVTEAIAEAKISRPTYYQLETRALNAMLAALNPRLAAQKASPDLSTAAGVEEMQGRIERLEQEKRRTRRLLLLTRKAIRAPVTVRRRGRPPKSALLGSIPNGAPRLKRSMPKAGTSAASTLTKPGESSP